MKRSRFSEEQIIAILKEQEAGMPTADVCRRHGVSSATFYKWKAKFGGLELSEAKRLRQLEDENAKLKQRMRSVKTRRFGLRFADGWSGSLGVGLKVGLRCFPIPGQEFVQAGLRMIGDCRDDVCEPRMRIDVVEFACLDECVDGGSALASAIRPTECPVPPSDCDGPHAPFCGIVGHTDASVLNEAGEALPS